MPTLSFNVTTESRGQVIDACIDAVGFLNDFGITPGLHSYKHVGGDVHSVRIAIKTDSVFGVRLSSALANIKRMPMVDAVKVF